MSIERPRCQFKGAPPHAAKPAYMLVWKLPSGDVTKFSCAAHRFSFGGKGYWINTVEGFWESRDTKQDRTRGVCALLETPIDGRLDSDDEPLSETTCVDPECGNPARRGEFCDECQKCWEDAQRAKVAAAAAESRPYAINKQRGF